MSIVTFLDLVQDDEFRSFVESRIAQQTPNCSYHFLHSFPILYKYQSLSEHAVNNVVNKVLSTTRIGEFNDLFDGALHQYGTDIERKKVAEDSWKQFEHIRQAANLSTGLLQHDSFVDLEIQHMKQESKLRFRQLDYLGTYVACFSTDMSSTLMWSHYAKSNTGICVGYDFNDSAVPTLLKKMVFPVAYSKIPINTNDLLSDQNRERYKYPLDAAILCAALNKADIWQYEKEWRFVFTSCFDNCSKYLPVELHASPSSISLGYHFIKPFFYNDYRNNEEIEFARKQIILVMRLLEYASENKIPLCIMMPSIGEYKLYPASISAHELITFMHCYFSDWQPEDIRYYYTVHDKLLKMVEREHEYVRTNIIHNLQSLEPMQSSPG